MCFSSEKVSKRCLNFEAIAGYDQAVRDRVGLLGYAEFSIIEIHVLYRLGMMEHKSHLFILSTTFCIYIHGHSQIPQDPNGLFTCYSMYPQR